MSSVYQYRVLKSSWGISIRLEGTIRKVSADAFTRGLINVSETINLAVQSIRLDEVEISHMVRGVERLRGELRRIYGKAMILIDIERITFSETDYQPEALDPAVAGWIAQIIGITFKEPEVTFDKATNRYLFTDAPD